MNDSKNDEETSIEEVILQTLKDEEEVPSQDPKPPETIYCVPIKRRPFFPAMAAPILIEPGPYFEVLKNVMRSKHKYIGLLLTKDEEQDINEAKFKDLHKVGVLGKILRILPMEQGGVQIVLNMEKRLKVVKPDTNSKHLRAKVRYHEDSKEINDEIKAYSISIITTIKELLKLNPLYKEELQIFLGHSDFAEPGRLADFAVALTTATGEELQEVLETFDIPTRINKALVLLKKELDLTLLQSSINQKLESGISKTQREFFLREQLKTIKKELGLEKDDKTHDIEKFDERLKQREVPEDVMQTIEEEMDKLQFLEPQSSEYTVCRNYLDWLTTIPWGITTKESHQLEEAQEILDKDHYGLKDIKERILEFISVGKLSGGVRGSIICLVGPPGVGKTSVGQSIARALNRKFYRFSVGGMRDEAEIKGHRRTYVGAMPGKMIQALKHTQTMNPIIMIDEVDKIGNSNQGDPASALLEVLDYEQNNEFLDHYLDVRCDLSNVLFIVTANILDTIPEPLRDRMDILRLSGYILEEKVQIANKFLIPKNRKKMGLKATEIGFSKSALSVLINGYARESGVRNLENLVKKILRKVAYKIVSQKEKHPRRKIQKMNLSNSNLEEYVGKPLFLSDRYYARTPVGVCMGLAWTSMGGATLYIEAFKVPAEKTLMKLTGQVGDVMKESSQIAWTYLHGSLDKYAKGEKFFSKSEIHMHIPEGATPKDGPSAGITMVTAMLSLILNKPILNDLGMTGELTLTGKVLPIGGVKEKLIASRRSGLKTLIFPKENSRDYDELPDYLKKGLKVHFVTHYDDVYKIAFSKRGK
ncbi:MAG: Lon protease 2 [Chlamydiae bacterium]|nr:Lon protease 2 [Chlamydiota bacterium]